MLGRGIANLLRDVLGANEQRTVVGVMTGELLEDWREYAYQKTQLEIQKTVSVNVFGLEYFERRSGDWWDKDGIVIRTFEAYKTECADKLADFVRRDKGLSEFESELWKRTYDIFGLDPDDNYTTSIGTGEVFRIEVKLGA